MTDAARKEGRTGPASVEQQPGSGDLIVGGDDEDLIPPVLVGQGHHRPHLASGGGWLRAEAHDLGVEIVEAGIAGAGGPGGRGLVVGRGERDRVGPTGVGQIDGAGPAVPTPAEHHDGVNLAKVVDPGKGEQTQAGGDEEQRAKDRRQPEPAKPPWWLAPVIYQIFQGADPVAQISLSAMYSR